MDARNPNAFQITFPSDREIAFRRVFEAPRRLVWDAWTKPEHVLRWYGCSIMTLVVCEIDLRAGGAYRLVMRGPDGTDWPTTGLYREVKSPERLVYTESFHGDPAKQALVTLTLEERDGRTTMRTTTLYSSVEDRDAAIRMGMEEGASESMDRLAALLPTIA